MYMNVGGYCSMSLMFEEQTTEVVDNKELSRSVVRYNKGVVKNTSTTKREFLNNQIVVYTQSTGEIEYNSKHRMTYKNGAIIEQIFEDIMKPKNSIHLKYQYLHYDKIGNWTKRLITKISDQNSEIDKMELREITYH